jgi:membrane associated rhomboid family serine protease
LEIGLWLGGMLPLWDANPPRRTPVMTVALISINTAVFVYQVRLALEGRVEPFVLQAFNGFGSLLGGGAGGGVAWWAHVGGFVTGAAATGEAGGRRGGQAT